MSVTARAVCGRVLSPPVWSPRFPGSLPYVEQPQSTSTDTSQTRHPVLPCTPDSCQYQMDIVRTRGCNLQMIRDLFNRITYSNCWTLNNWTNTSRPWPGLLVTQTGGWWYVTTAYVRSHHNIHVLRGCSGLLGCWAGVGWCGSAAAAPTKSQIEFPKLRRRDSAAKLGCFMPGRAEDNSYLRLECVIPGRWWDLFSPRHMLISTDLQNV